MEEENNNNSTPYFYYIYYKDSTPLKAQPPETPFRTLSFNTYKYQ